MKREYDASGDFENQQRLLSEPHTLHAARVARMGSWTFVLFVRGRFIEELEMVAGQGELNGASISRQLEGNTSV